MFKCKWFMIKIFLIVGFDRREVKRGVELVE